MSVSGTAHPEKIYTQAELDQAIKEAGFAAEPASQLLEAAADAIRQCDRLYGRTAKTSLWMKRYSAWLHGG